MKRIISLFLFQICITLLSFGQNPTFYIENRTSLNSQSSQIHTLWEGVKNPFIITSSDTTLDYSIYANGGKIVNQQKNHEFDLIPNQKRVTLYLITPNNDTLHLIKFISRKLIPPQVELTLGKNQIKDNNSIDRRDITKLQLNMLSNSQLKNDLIDLPEYDVGKIEIIHTRDKKALSKFSSLSSLNEIKSSAKKGDQIIIMLSSYMYKDEVNRAIENKFSEVYRLNIK